MKRTRLKLKEAGSSLLVTVLAIVVIIVVVAVALLLTHKKSTTNTGSGSTKSSQAQAPSGNKTVSGVVFATSLQSHNPESLPAQAVSSLNTNQTQQAGAQFVNVKAGYGVPFASSSQGVLFYGTTLKSLSSIDVPTYIKKAAEQDLGSGSSANTVVTKTTALNLKGSDGNQYPAQCYTINQTVSSEGTTTNYGGEGCVANVQKSTVYIAGQASDVQTGTAALQQLVQGTTLTLQ